MELKIEGMTCQHCKQAVQKALRAQGADPGDQTGRNADVPTLARALGERAEKILETA